MQRRKGFILVITLVVSSLILTMSLYFLTSAEKQSKRSAIYKNMLDKTSIKDREYLLTKAYNKISQNGENLISIKNYLNSNTLIVSENYGSVRYDKTKDMIYTINSFSRESDMASYYSYYDDSLSFSLQYTEFRNIN